ncbi:hypothetical protein MCA2108 [Methylococcus capsulatus str. Bath]|uniref:Uncharacterized protein n=2 Tax=Methylococcus capsulatus TaxID=414 RepID=Q606B3_METCA|nr:hypothetical protein MCA2108 [Methylococcus capsulatus str. Bath]
MSKLIPYPRILPAVAMALTTDLTHADISPVIQIFTGGLDGQGELTTSLHVNATPQGITRGSYVGEIMNGGGVRITPELSYGLLESLEGSLYLPVVTDEHGQWNVAGGIGRLTWVPIEAPDEGGWFLGTTWAFSDYNWKYSQATLNLNGGFTAGYDDDDWLFAINAFFNWGLNDRYQSSDAPGLEPAFAAKHYFGENLTLGLEYYGAIGPITHPEPIHLQSHTIFATVDWDEEDWSINFGIGRGMTSETDDWTIKTILFVPIGNY